MEKLCFINLTEKNLSKIKEVILHELCAIQKDYYFVIGEFILMLDETNELEKNYFKRAEQKNFFFRKLISNDWESKEYILNSEAYKIHKKNNIDISIFSSNISVECYEGRSIGGKYLNVFTLYVADILNKYLQCEMIVDLNVYNTYENFTYCKYQNGEKIILEQEKVYNVFPFVKID